MKMQFEELENRHVSSAVEVDASYMTTQRSSGDEKIIENYQILGDDGIIQADESDGDDDIVIVAIDNQVATGETVDYEIAESGKKALPNGSQVQKVVTFCCMESGDQQTEVSSSLPENTDHTYFQASIPSIATEAATVLALTQKRTPQTAAPKSDNKRRKRRYKCNICGYHTDCRQYIVVHALTIH